MRNKLEKWMERLASARFYVAVFVFVAFFSLIGYSCNGQQEREVIGHYNTLVDMCSKKEFSVAVRVSMTKDSLLVIDNLSNDKSFFYNLKNYSENPALEKAGYKEYLGFTDKVAVDFEKKRVMIMDINSCVYVLIHKMDKPEPQSQYNQRG